MTSRPIYPHPHPHPHPMPITVMTFGDHAIPDPAHPIVPTTV